jgi:hypothetical protein
MRILIKTAILTGALLLPSLCAAQGTSGYAMNGPSLGLVFESESAAVRPILGIPGAATLGAALAPGFAVERAVVAPGGDFALAIAKDDLRMAVIRATGTAQWLAPATGEAPDLIAFSPNGGSAALLYRASGRLVVVSGLRGQTPQIVTVDPASVPASPSLVAVSEDGASLLVAIPEGGKAALYSLPATHSTTAKPLAGAVRPESVTSSPAGRVRSHSPFAQRLGTFQSVSALRFAGTSSDALLADGKANAVYVIQDASGAAQIGALGSARDGLAQPVAIEAMDAVRVLVANAGTANLTILARDGAPSVFIPCGCQPAGLTRLAGNSVYRLTEPSKDPMWLLDAGGSEARILAIPPDRSQSASAATVEGVRR